MNRRSTGRSRALHCVSQNSWDVSGAIWNVLQREIPTGLSPYHPLRYEMPWQHQCPPAAMCSDSSIGCWRVAGTARQRDASGGAQGRRVIKSKRIFRIYFGDCHIHARLQVPQVARAPAGIHTQTSCRALHQLLVGFAFGLRLQSYTFIQLPSLAALACPSPCKRSYFTRGYSSMER